MKRKIGLVPKYYLPNNPQYQYSVKHVGNKLSQNSGFGYTNPVTYNNFSNQNPYLQYPCYGYNHSPPFYKTPTPAQFHEIPTKIYFGPIPRNLTIYKHNIGRDLIRTYCWDMVIYSNDVKYIVDHIINNYGACPGIVILTATHGDKRGNNVIDDISNYDYRFFEEDERIVKNLQRMNSLLYSNVIDCYYLTSQNFSDILYYAYNGRRRRKYYHVIVAHCYSKRTVDRYIDHRGFGAEELMNYSIERRIEYKTKEELDKILKRR